MYFRLYRFVQLVNLMSLTQLNMIVVALLWKRIYKGKVLCCSDCQILVLTDAARAHLRMVQPMPALFTLCFQNALQLEPELLINVYTLLCACFFGHHDNCSKFNYASNPGQG